MADPVEPKAPILVVGATGAQGGAVVRALLDDGVAVRALVREPESPGARILASLGAELVRGDLEDTASLAQALEGVRGVFSVQLYNPRDLEAEVRQGKALIQAAKAAGVEVFVQSSVSGTGAHRTMSGWAEGRWDRVYWDGKHEIEAEVQAAGFAAGVVLKPAFMMDNLIAPKAAWMFPDLASGKIINAIQSETRLALIAASDIGRVAARAFANPERFTGGGIELAGEWLTLPEVAAILSEVWGEAIVAETRSPAEVLTRGQNPGWVQTQEWLNEVGYPARPDVMKGFGVEPTGLSDWASKHRDRRPGKTA